MGEDRSSIEADAKLHVQLTGPTPRTADGKPDLTGVYWRPVVVDPGKPEWLPFAQKIAKERAENNRKDNPKARCLPSPLLFLGPLWEIVQSKSILVQISDDDNPGFHQIYIDGRAHPKDPDPQWYGHSVGHWEGDTLVVDRVNFDEISGWITATIRTPTNCISSSAIGARRGTFGGRNHGRRPRRSREALDLKANVRTGAQRRDSRVHLRGR